ncbi:hypothetical protein BH10PSE17_BH10PSE17_10880 [soil metagenome]
MTVPSVADMMQAYAVEAIEFAHKRFDVALDYSPASLAKLDTMVDGLSPAAPCGMVKKLFRKMPSEDEIEQMSRMLGGYLGEVCRRNLGGEWAVNEELEAIGILRQGDWIFPPAKVRKRLATCTSDNLVSYYEALRLSSTT